MLLFSQEVLCTEDGEASEKVTQSCCGYPVPGSVWGQAGGSSEQSGERCPCPCQGAGPSQPKPFNDSMVFNEKKIIGK